MSGGREVALRFTGEAQIVHRRVRIGIRRASFFKVRRGGLPVVAAGCLGSFFHRLDVVQLERWGERHFNECRGGGKFFRRLLRCGAGEIRVDRTLRILPLRAI